MGASKVDLHKRERDYAPLNLSDKSVIKYLLLQRSKVDVLYGASTNINIYQAGDVFEFNQELIALYTSLDVLLSRIELKERDAEFLMLIFEGHEMQDVIEHFNFPRMTAYRTLNRIIDKVVEENYISWKTALQRQGRIEHE